MSNGWIAEGNDPPYVVLVGGPFCGRSSHVTGRLSVCIRVRKRCMQRGKQGDRYDNKETAQRLGAALRGAFSGPPTPLKDIPKKSGEFRATRAGSASGATAKTAQPRT